MQPKEIAKHTTERNHFGEFCSLTFVIKTPAICIRDQAGPDIRLLKEKKKKKKKLNWRPPPSSRAFAFAQGHGLNFWSIHNQKEHLNSFPI